VIGGTPAAAGASVDIVAYPFGDYPLRYWRAGAPLSLTVIADAANREANARVDFSRAAVAVIRRGGAPLAVRRAVADNRPYGVPNMLRFEVDALAPGATYDVIVTGVGVRGASRTYRYWFRLLE
jgi:hypothetical protein